MHFSPVNALSKQRHAVRCGIKNKNGLKVRRYAARTIDQNDYLSV